MKLKNTLEGSCVKKFFLPSGKQTTDTQWSQPQIQFNLFKKVMQRKFFFNIYTTGFDERVTEAAMVFLAGYILVCLWNVCAAQSLCHSWVIHALGRVFVEHHKNNDSWCISCCK